MIKKIAVAAFVILTFIIYSFHQRSEGSQAVSQVTSNAKDAPQAVPVSSRPSTATNSYKDGTYTGKISDAIYGYIQVRATVAGGKLTNVEFLDHPQDRRNSVEINDYAMPHLKEQAIQAQSAQVDGVSGATDTSQAFIESLGDALSQAKA